MKISRRRVLVLTSLSLGLIVSGGLLYRALTRQKGENKPPLSVFSSESSKAPTLEKKATPQPKPPPATTAEALTKQIETALNSKDITDWEWVLNTLFPALAAKDRAAAARLVMSLPIGDAREQLLRRLARIWAAADFADAVSWIATLTDMADRKAAFEDACFERAGTEPGEAINAWETLEFTADDHVMENLVQNWAEKDLPAAQAWLSTKPSSKFRDQAVARIGYVMAKLKPADAATFVMAEIPVGPAQTEAAISVLYQWAQNDPAGAAAWVQHLPNGDLADRARTELAGLHPPGENLSK